MADDLSAVGSNLLCIREWELTLSLIIACAIKILFSTTLAGLIWCIGYIGYNHFKGTEDPDWEVLEEQRRYRDSTSA